MYVYIYNHTVYSQRLKSHSWHGGIYESYSVHYVCRPMRHPSAGMDICCDGHGPCVVVRHDANTQSLLRVTYQADQITAFNCHSRIRQTGPNIYVSAEWHNTGTFDCGFYPASVLYIH